MNCAHCATPIPEDARFCHSCGSQVSDAEGQAAATASMDASSFRHMEKLLREDTEGEFEIQGILGRGGMAVVFLAKEIKLGRKVAIKLLPPELTFGHGVERFMREAKTAAQLDHPNIIPIYRIASGTKVFWYAMKFLEGRSLDDVLKEKKKFTLAETIQILSQVGDALDYAHEHNVIHRDIKPANVMLDARNRVVVTDFGIAKALTERTLTASGSVVGTPYYMSPEQGMGRGVSGRSDQYSVAVMAYRMVSGQFPFEGESAIDILHKHCMEPAPSLESQQPGLPEHVYRAIHKALEKKQEQRFTTVAGFVSALRAPTAELATGAVSTEAKTLAVPAGVMRTARAAIAEGGLGTPPTPMPGSRTGMPPAAKPKSRRGVAVTLAALVVVGGVGGYVATRGGLGSPALTGKSAASGQAPQLDQPAAGGAAAAQPVDVASKPPEPAPAAAAPTTGRVRVSGLPSGGSVAIDGRPQRGTEFELATGSHEIRMAAAGFEPLATTITVRAGEAMAVTFTGQRIRPVETVAAQPPPAAGNQPTVTSPPASGTDAAAAAAQLAIVRISIQPWANVTIDGTSKGQQSRMVDTLIPGTHVLRFQRDGYLPIDTTVTLTKGDNRLTVTLRER